METTSAGHLGILAATEDEVQIRVMEGRKH